MGIEIFVVTYLCLLFYLHGRTVLYSCTPSFDLALGLPSASLSWIFMVLYIFRHIFVTFFSLPVSELSLVGLVD